jgi:hypothetical protein
MSEMLKSREIEIQCVTSALRGYEALLLNSNSIAFATDDPLIQQQGHAINTSIGSL